MKRNGIQSWIVLLSLIFFASHGAVATAQQGSAMKGSGMKGSAMKGSGMMAGYPRNESPPAGLEGVYSSYQEVFHFVPNVVKIMASSPALTQSYVNLQKNLKEHGSLSQAEINIVQLAISVENKCAYCVAGHTMAGKMFFKTPEVHMTAVRNRQNLSDPKLQALRNFAIAVYQGHGYPEQKYVDEFYQAGYTHAQSLDVVACIAAKVMTNFTNNLAGTEIDEPFKPLAVGLNFDH